MCEEIPIEELVKFQPKKLREYTISNADYTDHACSYIYRLSGGFIVFGGWLKVFVYNNIAFVEPDTSGAPFLDGGTVNWEKA